MFVFTPGGGNDVITDFSIGDDWLNVTELGITGFSDVALIGDTVIFDGVDTGRVRLLGVDTSQLTSADFVFG